ASQGRGGVRRLRPEGDADAERPAGRGGHPHHAEPRTQGPPARAHLV
ncbi:MAG: hypothetical protein AVDCRST_MAG79-192, partial [uncultured Thermoleophilia bacterium]